MSVLRFSLRAARKTAHIGNKVLRKGSTLADKVEGKATRILDGVDYSIKVDDVVPLEKIYYNSVPYVLPIQASMPAIGSKPTVTLLIPSLDGASFFGGTATALVVAAKIAKKMGRKLRIVQTLKTGQPGDLSEFFASEGLMVTNDDIQVVSVADRSYDQYGYVSMHRDDVFIASAWWDAYNLSRMPLQQKFIYLIQDFEPIFYNNSDMYVLAEETYKMDKFIPLCNTKLMAAFMEDRKYPAFSTSTLYFEPAVSRERSGLKKVKTNKDKKRLFLYGRPNVHRNLFFTALNAIDYAFKAGFLDKNEWECYMAGQDNLPDIQLSAGPKIQNYGKMSMEEYVNFSKTIDLAVSPMMAPHPNYPTLEFSSIGTAVVTTKYSNKTDLSNYSDNIFMADTDAESIAGAIKLASRHSSNKSTVQTRLPDDWNLSLDKTVDTLVSQL